jgi:hypothetical protein
MFTSEHIVVYPQRCTRLRERTLVAGQDCVHLINHCQSMPRSRSVEGSDDVHTIQSLVYFQGTFLRAKAVLFSTGQDSVYVVIDCPGFNKILLA